MISGDRSYSPMQLAEEVRNDTPIGKLQIEAYKLLARAIGTERVIHLLNKAGTMNPETPQQEDRKA